MAKIDLVFHGSPTPFGKVRPKRQVRYTTNEYGIKIVTFDRRAFHATHIKWIAIAYTARCKVVEHEGKRYVQRIGVNLFCYDPVIHIFGVGSLQQTLKEMYGAGGFLYSYREHHFFHTEGLGNLEVITTRRIRPHAVSRIYNPVEELKKHKITFEFIDLAQEKNVRFRF